MKRFAAFLLAALFCFSAAAFAEDGPFNCQYTDQFGGGEVVFYVKTGSTGIFDSPTIRFTMQKGTLRYCSEPLYSAYKVNVYGTYEIKVWYKRGNEWVLETDPNTDMYFTDSYEYHFKKDNSVYKVSIWTWRAGTTFTSYVNKGMEGIQRTFAGFSINANDNTEAYWSSLPSIYASNGNKCALFWYEP